MALKVRAYGARRCLNDGFQAAREGRLDDALFAMRAYFGLRPRASMSIADTDAAVLLATCATLRGDEAELAAVREMVGEDREVHLDKARAWLATLSRALAGDVEQVAASVGVTDGIPEGVAPALMLLAAERAPGSLNDVARAVLRDLADSASGALRARALATLARDAIARGDRVAARAELEAIAADAPPLYRFYAALDTGRAELARRWTDVPLAERAAAGVFVAAFAVGASVIVLESIVDVLANDLPPATRATLEAEVMVARVRAGDPGRALETPASTTANPILSAARGQALLAAGRFTEADAELSQTDAPRDLVLLTAAALGADARLVDLMSILADVLPASAVRAAIAAHFAVRSELPASLPAWLDQEPDDPLGQYGWALLQTRRGRGAKATAAFERALAARPALASLGDAPDVARLLAASDAIRTNALDAAEAALQPISSARLERPKMLLRAFLLVRRAANAQQMHVDEGSLGQLVRDLGTQLPPGDDHIAVSLLIRQADALRASFLLRAGRASEAAPIIARLPRTDLDGAFLHAMLAILDARPLADIERELAEAVQLHPDARTLALLLAEVRGSRGGAEARVASLERLRSSSASSELVEEALASAYGGARRGLDAKRVALEEVRRRGALGTLLSAQLREALAFESPPRHVASTAADTTNAPLPEATIRARAHLLVSHAQEVARTSPARRDAIEDALGRFKRALVSDELAAAVASELDVLSACSGAAP